MGVTAHELQHLLRAFEGLDDVDVILDNTLAGPLHRQVATDGPRRARWRTGRSSPSSRSCTSPLRRTSRSWRSRRTRRRSRGPVPIARVIHHGIRVEDVPVGTGGDYACFVGRMHPSKGMPEAIEAAAIAGIPLRIAAKMQEPAEQEYYEEVVRPALGTNAEYLGELDGRREVRADGKLVRAAQPDPVG